MQKTPILAALKAWQGKEQFSLHMPGHKNGKFIADKLRENWGNEIFGYDLTELPGLDNLQHPSGCIREAERKAAELCGAAHTFFLVNGSSIGLQSAIFALAGESKIFLPRTAHRSVYDALIFSGSEPCYLQVDYDKETGMPLGVTPESIEEAVAEHPDCRTILFIHPNYQGFTYQARESFARAKELGLKIIVDGAHGSHLHFHESLPPSALELGADVVVESWHKTLPSLTQTAVMHLAGDEFAAKIKETLNMFHTTSPSYLFLASLDTCREIMEKEGRETINRSLHELKRFRERAGKRLKKIRLLSPELARFEKDPFKLLLFPLTADGKELTERLSSYGLFPEMSERKYSLLMVGLKFSREEADYLLRALEEIEEFLPALSTGEQLSSEHSPSIPPLPPLCLRPREAYFSPREKIAWEKAGGRIAAEFLVKYPPGIPLFVPGEELSLAVLEYMLREKLLPLDAKLAVLQEKER